MSHTSYGAPGAVRTEIGVVRAIYEAFAGRDLDAALAHLADDVELVLPETARRAGRPGPYRGHAGVRAYFADLAAVWQELTLQADDIRATTGGVIVFGSVDGRLAGGAVHRRVMWTWKLRDGLASSVRVTELGRG